MHFLSRSMPRRTVLKGMGATLALPFLEAMLPASTLRAADKPVRRFQAFYTPNGMAMEYWSPRLKVRTSRSHRSFSRWLPIAIK